MQRQWQWKKENRNLQVLTVMVGLLCLSSSWDAIFMCACVWSYIHMLCAQHTLHISIVHSIPWKFHAILQNHLTLVCMHVLVVTCLHLSPYMSMYWKCCEDNYIYIVAWSAVDNCKVPKFLVSPCWERERERRIRPYN